MNPAWSALLNTPSTSATTCALEDYTIITVTGPDAVTFLQGQCTCDFNSLTDSNQLLGAHCNAKGRMISSFVAAKLGDEIIGLRVHNSIADIALIALKKYAVFSKVVLDISDWLAVASKTPLELAGKTFSYSLGQESSQGDVWYETWLKADTLINAKTPLNNSSHWQQACINAGICHVQNATSEQHLPQAFNYDLIAGINFKKGCYTGQEIIARLHYRGTSKQRLHLVTLDCQGLTDTSDIALNAAIVNAENKNIGQIVDLHLADGCYQLLVCTSAFHQEDGALFIENIPSQPLTRAPLPYLLP